MESGRVRLELHLRLRVQTKHYQLQHEKKSFPNQAVKQIALPGTVLTQRVQIRHAL